MEISRRAQTGDLGANLKRMFARIRQREIQDFLREKYRTFFLFNGVLYQQIDGVAMGSPLGPLFANIFLSFHEKGWLSKCPADFKP